MGKMGKCKYYRTLRFVGWWKCLCGMGGSGWSGVGEVVGGCESVRVSEGCKG